MALGQIPPWLQVTPQFFTQALEAGARAGLGVAEMQQRAAQLAAARLERQEQAQERADRAAERAQEFDATRLLRVQDLAQDAARQEQLQRHQMAQEAGQAAQESRLLDYQKGMLNVARDRETREAAPLTPSLVDFGGNKAIVMGKSVHPIPPPSVASMPPHERVPIEVRDKEGNVIALDVGGNRLFAPPKPTPEGKLSDADKALLAGVAREESSLLAELRGTSKKATREALQEQLLAVQRRRNTILRNAGSPVSPTVLPPASTNVIAAPRSVSEKIRVRRLADGSTGTISIEYFDPAVYERLP